MKNFNKTLLSTEQYTNIQPKLLRAFGEFTPRSTFIKKNSAVESHNRTVLDSTEQPNLLAYPTLHAPNELENVSSFYDVFRDSPLYELLASKFDIIDKYVAEHTVNVKNSFITFSTNITGARIGVKHLHSLLNGNCCNVWSFAVPLWIDPSNNDYANFWYNSSADLFPPRYYVDYERVKRLDIQYTGFRLPKDGSVLSIQFDGSRTPHYIDYTSHLYAFVVFDGITHKNPIWLGKQLIMELL